MDGLGDDWPIGYEDLKPFYDKVDRLVGIFGTAENLPNEPDGIFLPPPKPRCYELLIKEAATAQHPVIPSRLSILTEPHNGRQQCHYCSQCGRGCQTNSNFSSTGVLIPPAMKTGRLTLIANAMAREVTSIRMAWPTAWPTSTRRRIGKTTSRRASWWSPQVRANRLASC